MSLLKTRVSPPKTADHNHPDYYPYVFRDAGDKYVKQQYLSMLSDDDALVIDISQDMFRRKRSRKTSHHDKAPRAHQAHDYSTSLRQVGAGSPSAMQHGLVALWLKRRLIDTAPEYRELLRTLKSWRRLTANEPREEQDQVVFSIAMRATPLGWLQSVHEKSLYAGYMAEWFPAEKIRGRAPTLVPRYVEHTKQKRLTGPIQFLRKLLDTWHLEYRDAARLLGLEGRDTRYVNELLNGRVALRGTDAEQRIVYLFRIRKTLFALFRDEEVENEWLREPRDVLGGKTPLDRLRDGEIESMVLVKELVEAAAGR